VVICWPLALIAAVPYPIVWLFLLPFRLVGIAVHGALELVAAIIFLPVCGCCALFNCDEFSCCN